MEQGTSITKFTEGFKELIKSIKNDLKHSPDKYRSYALNDIEKIVNKEIKRFNAITEIPSVEDKNFYKIIFDYYGLDVNDLRVNSKTTFYCNTKGGLHFNVDLLKGDIEVDFHVNDCYPLDVEVYIKCIEYMFENGFIEDISHCRRYINVDVKKKYS